MLSTNAVLNIRVLVFGLTGATCLIYALLAVTCGRPDPFSPWIPGIAGVVSALVVMVATLSAGARNAAMAQDEGFSHDCGRAQGVGYRTVVLLYPVFGYLLSQGMTSYVVAFAAMAIFTAAAFLLPFVWFDLKGRA